METKNQNKKWTEVAEKSHQERFIALAQKLRSEIMKLTSEFHFNEFVNYSIDKLASKNQTSTANELLLFIKSFSSFYTDEELFHIYEIYPVQYIQLMNTTLEVQQCMEDMAITQNSILTIENLIRIPIYCN